MATSVCVSVDTIPTEFLIISLCCILLNLQNGMLGLIFHGFVMEKPSIQMGGGNLCPGNAAGDTEGCKECLR